VNRAEPVSSSDSDTVEAAKLFDGFEVVPVNKAADDPTTRPTLSISPMTTETTAVE
jgi:hypothetical protein